MLTLQELRRKKEQIEEEYAAATAAKQAIYVAACDFTNRACEAARTEAEQGLEDAIGNLRAKLIDAAIQAYNDSTAAETASRSSALAEIEPEITRLSLAVFEAPKC